MHSSPNILRSSVIGCVSKYEPTKRGVMKECFVLKQRFFGKKRVILLHNIRFTAETGKRQTKYGRGLKKSHRKLSTSKWNFFPKKRHSKSWSEKFFFRPPKLGAKSPPMN